MWWHSYLNVCTEKVAELMTPAKSTPKTRVFRSEVFQEMVVVVFIISSGGIVYVLSI